MVSTNNDVQMMEKGTDPQQVWLTQTHQPQHPCPTSAHSSWGSAFPFHLSVRLGPPAFSCPLLPCQSLLHLCRVLLSPSATLWVRGFGLIPGKLWRSRPIFGLSITIQPLLWLCSPVAYLHFSVHGSFHFHALICLC